MKLPTSLHAAWNVAGTVYKLEHEEAPTRESVSSCSSIVVYYSCASTRSTSLERLRGIGSERHCSQLTPADERT